MKVLHVINSLSLGGAEVLLRNLMPHFARLGVQSSVYVLRTEDTPLARELRAEGTTIWSGQRASVYSSVHARDLAVHLAQHDYDLVHVHLFPAQLWVALGRMLSGKKVPMVTTEHSTVNQRRKPWFRALDLWVYRHYAAVACISEATATALVDWVPYLADRVPVVRNGISTEQFRTATAAKKTQIIGMDDVPVVLFVARFGVQKDHTTLLRAMAQVPDAHLVLVGEGPLRPEMESLVKALGIGERVHFLGWRRDVPQLMKMADVYVQSSHWEGFGLAVVEAMAGGLPVVASRVPGLMDVVGEAGLLFEPGNHQQLAEHVQALLHNPPLRAQLAREAQARAQGYSIESTAEQYFALYQATLAKRAAR